MEALSRAPYDHGRVPGKELADTGRACGRRGGSTHLGWASVATKSKEAVAGAETVAQARR